MVLLVFNVSSFYQENPLPNLVNFSNDLEIFIVTTISHVENMKCENADK